MPSTKQRAHELYLERLSLVVNGISTHRLVKHGTTTGYYRYHCKCDACRDAMRHYEGVESPRK